MFIETSDFPELLSSGAALLDVRAEIEFESASLPRTYSAPILTTSEREAVGICYADHGQDAAIALGHQLVHGETKLARIEAWKTIVQEQRARAVMCWRGGMRSQLAQEWLLQSGIAVPRIRGGYKALRSYLLGVLPELLNQCHIIVIGGKTGCGKTALLESIQSQFGVLDLEALANHRGSAFGDVLGEQPTQSTFENHLVVALLQLTHAGKRHIIVESESRLIGRLALPNALCEAMSNAPFIELQCTEQERIDRTINEYVICNPLLSSLPDNQRLNTLREYLRRSIEKISRRLGGVRTQEALKCIDEACTRSEPTAHQDWISSVLTDYYDPFYARYLEANASRTVFRGTKSSVCSYLTSSILDCSAHHGDTGQNPLR